MCLVTARSRSFPVGRTRKPVLHLTSLRDSLNIFSLRAPAPGVLTSKQTYEVLGKSLTFHSEMGQDS